MDAHDHADRAAKYPNGTTRRKRPREPHPAALAYSIDEAAHVLGVSRRTIYELIAEGRLRSAKLYARRLIPRAELERLLAEGTE